MHRQLDLKATNSIILRLSFLIGLLSLFAFLYNELFIHFRGNNYLTPAVAICFVLIATIMPLIELGVVLYYQDRQHPFKLFAREVFYFYLTVGIIVLATNAIQLTPFEPIDPLLIQLDKAMGFDQASWMSWTANNPWLYQLLEISYASLNYQLILIPLLVILSSRFYHIREFYLLLLLTCLLGFSFYYFFPSKAPSSYIHSLYFTAEQYATGIKFDEIHRFKSPSTMEGGLIAMPSFHFIWAWLCVFLARDIQPVFYILIALNLLLTLSCILLGWHYLADILGSLIILASSFAIYSKLMRHLTIRAPSP